MEGNGQSDLDMQYDEDSVIMHNGKKYQRIAIEGLPGDDDEYLMDED